MAAAVAAITAATLALLTVLSGIGKFVGLEYVTTWGAPRVAGGVALTFWPFDRLARFGTGWARRVRRRTSEPADQAPEPEGTQITHQDPCWRRVAP